MTQQPETTKAFVTATGTDATTAHKFLSARNYDLESAIILFTQNYQFLSEVNAFYKDHPPFPFAILERNLFSFTPAMSNDTAGVPVLIVNLEHWDPTWTFKDLEALRGLQWVVHWILNKALQISNVQARGLTLLSNTELAPPTVPVSDIHVILLEFILNVVPIKLKSLIICHAAPVSYFSRVKSMLSPNGGLLQGYGVEIIECNKRTLVSHVDAWNLPTSLDGKLTYRHEDWYQEQIPHFSRLEADPPAATIKSVIAAQKQEMSEPSIVAEIFSDVRGAVVGASSAVLRSTRSVVGFKGTQEGEGDALVGETSEKVEMKPLSSTKKDDFGTPYSGWENVQSEPENPNNEGWLARMTRATQMASLQTSRAALAKLNQTEEITTASMTKLNQQGEQLNRIAHKLDTADSHAQIADAKANQLKSTNRFFMLPTSFADKKAASVEAQQNERMEAQGEAEAKRRVAASTNNGASYISLSNTTTSSSYYTTPDGLERDEVEEEIDSSLGQMAAGLGRMKQMANAMSTELDNQNESIKQTKSKVDEVKNRVEVTNAKIKKIK